MLNKEFYVDVNMDGIYGFYYNMVAEVNENVQKALGYWNFAHLEITKEGREAYNRIMDKKGKLPKRSFSQFGVIGSLDTLTNELEFGLAEKMKGISASVTSSVAREILELAKFWCPVDTGHLRDSGTIVEQEDGSCRIVFDCPYAWYVHEFTWKNHEYPTRARFLSDAINYVYKIHNLK